MLNPLSFVTIIPWAQVGKVLSASVTLLVAVIATYIAWQQHTLNRRQYRLALFKKRMAVFNATMNMIASVMRSANPTLEECFQFIKETRDHEFLFGPEVGEFINEVFKKANILRVKILADYSGPAAQQAEILEWSAGQMGDSKKIFLRYLDFRRP